MPRLLFAFLFSIFCLEIKAQDDCQFHRLEAETTPLGRTLEYRQRADSVSYQLFYGQDSNLKLYDRIFDCHHAPITRPEFVDENDQYVFMSRGCGSACSIGLLLDIDSDKKVRELNYWLAADLKQELIATVDFDSTVFVKVYDLASNKEIKLGSIHCNFGITVGCVKEVEMKNRRVTVHWADELKEKSVSYDFGN